MEFYILLVLFLAALVLLPLVILFGVLGMAFQSVGGAILFVLKYMLPGVAVGLLITYIRSRRDYGYEWEDYAKGAGIGVAVCFVLFLLWLRVLPVDLKAPEFEDVSLVVVSRGMGETYESEQSTDVNRIENIYDDIFAGEYYRTVKELRYTEENEGYPITVELFDGKGDSLGRYEIYNSGCLKKNGFWYAPKGEHSLHRDTYLEVIYDVKKEMAEEKWRPFVGEIFSSVEYDQQEGEILFTIPRTIPDMTDSDSYRIHLNIVGMVGCTDADAYEARSYQIYSDEQENSTWEANTTYSLPDINNALWEKIEISFSAPYVKESFDCISLLPENLVK